jgi:D-glycero-D-manno-heptose 1,7-bisphosphate phosphatase
LIRRATSDFGIDLEQSWMIGDRYSDVELARNSGLKSAFVLSGYGRGEWENQRMNWKTQPDLISQNLLTAVQSIIEEQSGVGRTMASKKDADTLQPK